jgi:hypothetical protein
MPKMTEEHREFLGKKTTSQLEHVAGCEQCFNYYLFGEEYRCKEYPSKYRIKDSDFKRLLRLTSSAEQGASSVEHGREILAQLLVLLRRRFKDDSLDEETLDEVTIVPDGEWVESAAAVN